MKDHRFELGDRVLVRFKTVGGWWDFAAGAVAGDAPDAGYAVATDDGDLQDYTFYDVAPWNRFDSSELVYRSAEITKHSRAINDLWRCATSLPRPGDQPVGRSADPCNPPASGVLVADRPLRAL